MNISSPFIARPVATSLLMVGLLLVGLAAYPLLPVASLPNVNYPTISVTAQLPGADPQTMASSVATPLEEQFGQIPGVTQMTSSSALGTTSVTLQFDLSRDIEGAATDTLAAINAAGGQLPPAMIFPPTIRKVNPADTPILVLALTSSTLPLTTIDAYAENILFQKISQISGVGLVTIGGQQKPAIRVQVNPQALAARGVGLEDVRNVISQANVDQPKGTPHSARRTYTINTNDQLLNPDAYNQLIVAYRNGSPVRVQDIGTAVNAPENDLLAGWVNQQRAVILARHPAAARRQRHRDGRSGQSDATPVASCDPKGHPGHDPIRPHANHPCFGQRRALYPGADGRAGGDGDLRIPAKLLGDGDSRRHGAAVADRHFRNPLWCRL